MIEKYPEEMAKMRAAYDKWWDEITPCLINENAIEPVENPFKTRYWQQFGRNQ